MIFGLIILAIGVLILLQYFGVITGDVWTIFWGVVLVLVGLSFVAKKDNPGPCSCWPFKADKKKK